MRLLFKRYTLNQKLTNEWVIVKMKIIKIMENLVLWINNKDIFLRGIDYITREKLRSARNVKDLSTSFGTVN
jgi:hypothetical protein